jgi:hypothetical protein
MDPQDLESLAQIGRHLDKAEDPTLLILRAHLLVEERLRDIVNRICRSPDTLRAAPAVILKQAGLKKEN